MIKVRGSWRQQPVFCLYVVRIQSGLWHNMGDGLKYEKDGVVQINNCR